MGREQMYHRSAMNTIHAHVHKETIFCKRTERRSMAGEWLFGKNIMNV
jgi:hypothetical protein